MEKTELKPGIEAVASEEARKRKVCISQEAWKKRKVYMSGKARNNTICVGPAISRETLKARQKFGFDMSGNGMQL